MSTISDKGEQDEIKSSGPFILKAAGKGQHGKKTNQTLSNFSHS